MKKFHDKRDRFFDLRFGLFIHWGLYAIPAWHEQILWRGDITRREYEKLIDVFNPLRFEPEAWLDAAESAGMQYLCFTTKHHDGFCMWDTDQTGYKVTRSPYGRDVVAELAKACRRRNFPLSFYYSCPDWHHPNYPNQGRHHEMFGPRPGDEPDLDRYYAYVEKQIEELLTRYGPVYQLFWDVNVAGYRNPALNAKVRELQPGILINNRGPDEGDYQTPERSLPERGAFPVPTEACQSLGRESWGFRQNEDFYSARFLMGSIDRVLAMGGNYLLNAGPQADGALAEENLVTLGRIGDWYKRVKEAFSGTEPASHLGGLDAYQAEDDKPRTVVRDRVLLTRRGNTLFVHASETLQSDTVILKPLAVKPRRAVLLNDGREIESAVDLLPWYWRERPYLRLRRLPVDEITGEPLVIRLEFDDKTSPDSPVKRGSRSGRGTKESGFSFSF